MVRDASFAELCGCRSGRVILVYCYYDTDFYWITPLIEEAASICHSIASD
jgi:hypothetical protein